MSTHGTSTPQTSHLCNWNDKAIYLSLRVALPVCRTTPNAALHREGGIPPAKILLEANRLRLVYWINSPENLHPLRFRANVCPNMGILKSKKTRRLSKRPELYMSRMQRAYCQFPPAEASESLPAPIYIRKLGT